tara:strand:- start:287 stop:412 length:126 start_codon:yes stop_codon:yes gene_type:complete
MVINGGTGFLGLEKKGKRKEHQEEKYEGINMSNSTKIPSKA